MTRYALPQIFKGTTIRELSLLAVSGRALRNVLMETKPRSHILQEQEHVLSAEAFEQASVKFFKRHPSWRASLFDEHFLKSWALPLAERWRKYEGFPTADELARAWSEQIWLRKDKRERLIQVATPVAADFMDILEQQLAGPNKFGLRTSA